MVSRLTNTVPRANADRQGTGLSGVKIRQVIQRLEQEGWRLVATRGSHRQFKHPQRAGRVTVAGKPGDELAPGTLQSIAKHSGLQLL